ncbi:hypothetical protein Tsubulata_008350 [Turnera subulata]|uniref:J domain-containing protein n=1 Tax=Turnera subulata TaxID=218843 RepID=A0A9Q0JDM9_9ROSI|nr:hypothetical protein Tsubulata_008350 [Turnera subulata]
MDYYKVLGIGRNASKEEIKAAFRRQALDCHPDKHTHSPKSVRDSATLRFKLISEAYDVLRDDRKRARYNITITTASSTSSSYNNGGGYYYDRYSNYHSYSKYNYNKYSYSSSYYGYSTDSFDLRSKLASAFRALSARVLLLNFAFASALVGGSVIFDMSREALWKMHNSGKSFEEAMDSIEKAKKRRDNG